MTPKQPQPSAHALPKGEPHFIGRTDETTQVVEHLLHGRSILIHGEPGIGKTELAIHALRSQELQNAYKDRILWFERTPAALADLCDAVARQINAPAVWQSADLDDKCAILRAKLGESPPFLAFNNADGPSAAAVAAFCARVVPAPVLATSRDPVAGLERLRLEPLSEDDAVKLFAAHSGDSKSAKDPNAREVVKFLERNPLAVVLAAGRLLGLDSTELLKQLRARPLDVLTGPNRSVRASFDLSFQYLTPAQQALFPALGLFAGPDFSLEAVRSMSQEDVALDLGNLVQVSLVRFSQESNRYSLHPLLHEYALSKQQTPAPLQLRLAGYYAAYAQQHSQATADDLDAVALEFSNIQGSVQWCISKKSERDAGIALVATYQEIQWFLKVRGYWTQRILWGEAAVAAAKALGDDHLLAQTAGNLAIAYQNTGDLERAKAGLQDSLEALQRLKDEGNIAAVLHQLGILAQGQGRLEEAADYYRRSMEIAERLGDQSGIASTLHQLGWLDEAQNHLSDAAEKYQQALAIFERLKSPYAEIARTSLQRVQGALALPQPPTP